MKRPLITSLLAIALLAPLCAGRIGAQQAGQDQADKQQAASPSAAAPTYPLATLQRDFKNSFPIPAGEKLEYEVKISRFPLFNASLGVLTLENLGAVTNSQNSVAAAGDQQKAPAPLIEGMNTAFTPAPDEQLLRLRATAVSKGMLTALVGYDVRNRFETLVDLRDFSARVSFKEEKEGKRHVVQSTIFDRAEQQVRYLTTDLAKPDAPPRAKPLPREDGMLGLLSAIYFVRLQKLNEGQMLSFPVSVDEANYQFEVLVGKRESLKTECGMVKTVKLEPKLFGLGRYFNKLQGEMTMWVSDDNKRTPLRLVAKTNKGTFSAKLLNFKKKCNIIEPEDEVKQKND
ncbi:MAG TPA: DUF3108 domain-containing protein [Blastocatellia bacterium]|nr:DUF3108 domain-containing protein [Blastocatellia bacterium]